MTGRFQRLLCLICCNTWKFCDHCSIRRIINREEIIQRLIEETGKTYTNAESDYQMLSDCLCYFIREMKSMQGQLLPDYEDKHISMIIRKPLGVVVGYLAWNFPLLNAGYKLGPALAAGCTCILKPSSLTPLTTLYLEIGRAHV